MTRPSQAPYLVCIRPGDEDKERVETLILRVGLPIGLAIMILALSIFPARIR